MSLKPAVKPEWQPPTQEELEAKALDYLKVCQPKDYQELEKAKKLQEVIHLMVKAAQELAAGLIESGVWEREAWNRAIRQEILESESD